MATLLELLHVHPLTEMGNAAAFSTLYGATTRYNHTRKKWMVWDTNVWKEATDGEVSLIAQGFIAGMKRTAAAENMTSVATYFKGCETARDIQNLLELAQARCPIKESELDSGLLTFNTVNGILDLPTRKLFQSSPLQRVSRIAGCPYVPGAVAPRWEAFLRQVLPDEDARTFVQRAVGYSMTGLIREQVLFVMAGLEGLNGKSTFIETIRYIMNTYAVTSDTSLLLKRRGDTIRNDIARLNGARFVAAQEVDKRRELDSQVVKLLTGNDTISARFLYEEGRDFRPTWHIWLSCNHVPLMDGSDSAIWRRMRIVPWNVRIPEHRIDLSLQDKLLEEAPGILNWSLVGFDEWQRDGLGVSATVDATTKEYRDEMDSVSQYLRERCKPALGSSVSKTLLFDDFQIWCKREGHADSVSKNEFSKQLKRKGYRDGARTSASRTWADIKIVVPLIT